MTSLGRLSLFLLVLSFSNPGVLCQDHVLLISKPASRQNTAECLPEVNETIALLKSKFPEGFKWGIGSSAGQIEGAYLTDGRTASAWDAFSLIPGKIYDGSNASVACDSYHKYLEDINLAEDMGFNSYRFSISWSRLLPNGGKVINPKAVKYYTAILDTLHHKSMSAFVTLHHMDLPIEVEQQGGWLNSTIIDLYRSYAEVCFSLFGHRVQTWTTLNEPYHMSIFEYANGEWPPARCSDRSQCREGNSAREPYTAMHNMLLAHAEIVFLYRSKYQGKNGGQIGINLEGPFYYPFDNKSSTLAAVERAFAWRFRWAWDAVYLGDYPTIMKDRLGSRLPSFTDEQKALLAGSVDYFGLNYYTSSYTRSLDESPNFEFSGADAQAQIDAQYTTSNVDARGNSIGPPSGFNFRPQVPRGIFDMLIWIRDRYPAIPIIIGENGYSGIFSQGSTRTDEICDKERSEFFRDHILYTANAISEGVNVKGFYAWSLLDSWEWAYGYEVMFGMVYVDFNDPQRARTPKASCTWWSNLLTGREADRGTEVAIGRVE